MKRLIALIAVELLLFSAAAGLGAVALSGYLRRHPAAAPQLAAPGHDKPAQS